MEEAENKEWELEYLKGKVKNLEANFGAMVNVAFPAGGETWFDGYRKGFKDAHNDLVAQGAAAIIQESETVVKNEKEPGGDSEYEEIEVEFVLLPLTCHCPGLPVGVVHVENFKELNWLHSELMILHILPSKGHFFQF